MTFTTNAILDSAQQSFTLAYDDLYGAVPTKHGKENHIQLALMVGFIACGPTTEKGFNLIHHPFSEEFKKATLALRNRISHDPKRCECDKWTLEAVDSLPINKDIFAYPSFQVVVDQLMASKK